MKTFFKNETERNLWLRLNAEQVRYSNNIVNNSNIEDLGDIDTVYTPYWISNNQLVYDEKNRDAPRLSLEELSSLCHEEIFALSRERNSETLKQLFENFPKREDEL